MRIRGFPHVVTVGQQNVPAQLVLTNQSSVEYSDDTFEVFAIELTPSCGSKLGLGECPPGGEDPGVFVLDPIGTGVAGTACGGQTFNIALIDPVEGRYSFTPTTQVRLGPTGTTGPPARRARSPSRSMWSRRRRRTPIRRRSCRVRCRPISTRCSVSVSIIDPNQGGNTLGQTGAGIGTDETTVLLATPAIATAVSSPSIPLTGTFTDTATITTPAGSPAPTGTVNFFVYGPNDATCAGAPIASSLNRPVGAGGTATSGTFGPFGAGTYRVIAVYSGDVNYTPISGACNDPNETVVVQPATPQIATAVSDDTLTIGQSFTDTATVTVPAGAPAPTGTVDFFVYAPGDITCTGAPFASSLGRPVGAGGVATSEPFTPNSVGTYRVIARYNGDTNYNSVRRVRATTPGENVVVSQATPGIVTSVNDSAITLGETFTDTATVTVPAGAPAPTGTVDFFVYGPDDATCAGAPSRSRSARPLVGGTATSAAFSPDAVGTYRVIARYNGDANYTAVSGLCNDANETTVVAAGDADDRHGGQRRDADDR